MKINFILQKLELKHIIKKSKLDFHKKLSKGDFISVIYYDLEKEQARVQQFTGVCIKLVSRGLNTKITVRTTVVPTIVEQQFFLYSPSVLDFAILEKNNSR